jgi:hypothetical protein
VRRDCRQFVGDCGKCGKKRIVVELGSGMSGPKRGMGERERKEEVIVEFCQETE